MRPRVSYLFKLFLVINFVWIYNIIGRKWSRQLFLRSTSQLKTTSNGQWRHIPTRSCKFTKFFWTSKETESPKVRVFPGLYHRKNFFLGTLNSVTFLICRNFKWLFFWGLIYENLYKTRILFRILSNFGSQKFLSHGTFLTFPRAQF